MTSDRIAFPQAGVTVPSPREERSPRAHLDVAFLAGPVGPSTVRPAKRTAPGRQQLVTIHPLQSTAAMGIAGITVPGPRCRLLHHSGSHRVEAYVSGHRPEGHRRRPRSSDLVLVDLGGDLVRVVRPRTPRRRPNSRPSGEGSRSGAGLPRRPDLRASTSCHTGIRVPATRAAPPQTPGVFSIVAERATLGLARSFAARMLQADTFQPLFHELVDQRRDVLLLDPDTHRDSSPVCSPEAKPSRAWAFCRLVGRTLRPATSSRYLRSSVVRRNCISEMPRNLPKSRTPAWRCYPFDQF